MNITERAQLVLQQIDADLALAEAQTKGKWIRDGYDIRQPSGRHIAYIGPHHTPPDEYPLACRLEDERNGDGIAASRTGWPTALRCLKTAIEELLKLNGPLQGLAALCNQWQKEKQLK